MNTSAFARLYDGPVDDAQWLVLADELQASGDFRGELISSFVRGDQPRFRLSLQRYLHEVYDAEERAALEHHVKASYENGLWCALEVRDGAGPSPTGDTLARLLVSPLAALVRTLEVQLGSARDARRVAHSLERGALALRELRVSVAQAWDAEGCFVPPRLQNVTLWNVENATELKHDRLKTLRLTLSPKPKLGPLQFPSLDLLELRSYGDLSAAEMRLDLPSLRKLTVQTFPGLVEQLAALPCCGTLEHLALESVDVDSGLVTGRALLDRLHHFQALREFEWHDGPQDLAQEIRSRLDEKKQP